MIVVDDAEAERRAIGRREIMLKCESSDWVDE
jgi:hypothetical protein